MKHIRVIALLIFLITNTILYPTGHYHEGEYCEHNHDNDYYEEPHSIRPRAHQVSHESYYNEEPSSAVPIGGQDRQESLRSCRFGNDITRSDEQKAECKDYPGF